MRADRDGKKQSLLSKVLLVALLALGASSVAVPLASAATPVAAPAAGNSSTTCRNQTSSLARLACLSKPKATPTSRRQGPPPGARAVCRDGTYSFSSSRWVACRFHGGVRVWLG